MLYRDTRNGHPLCTELVDGTAIPCARNLLKGSGDRKVTGLDDRTCAAFYRVTTTTSQLNSDAMVTQEQWEHILWYAVTWGYFEMTIHLVADQCYVILTGDAKYEYVREPR